MSVWDSLTIPSAPGVDTSSSATAINAGGHDNSEILSWANETQSNAATQAAKVAKATQEGHAFNPLNQNNVIDAPEVGSQNIWKNFGTSLIDGSVVKGLSKGLDKISGIPSSFMGIAQDLSDISKDPYAYNTTNLTKEIPKATPEASRQMLGTLLRGLGANDLVGLVENATHQDLGTLHTPIGDFQSPASRAAERIANSDQPYSNKEYAGAAAGIVGNQSLEATSSIGLFAGLSSLASKAILKVADIASSKGVTLTRGDVQAIVNGEKVAPEKLQAFKQAANDNPNLAKEIRNGASSLVMKESTPFTEALKSAVTKDIAGGSLRSMFGLPDAAVNEAPTQTPGAPLREQFNAAPLPQVPEIPLKDQMTGSPHSELMTPAENIVHQYLKENVPAYRTTDNAIIALQSLIKDNANYNQSKSFSENIQQLTGTSPEDVIQRTQASIYPPEAAKASVGSATESQSQSGSPAETSQSSSGESTSTSQSANSANAIGGEEHQSSSGLSQGSIDEIAKAQEKAASKLQQSGSLNLGNFGDYIKDKINNIKKGKADSVTRERIRTQIAADHNVRKFDANVLADQLRKEGLGSAIDRRALTIAKEFADNPGELESYINGSHSDFTKAAKQFKEANPDATTAEVQKFVDQNKANVAKLASTAKRALNLPDSVKAADAKIVSYYKDLLETGRKGEFLDSSIAPEKYTPRELLNPNEHPDAFKASTTRGKLSKYFQNAKARQFDTTIQAMSFGYIPKSLDILDAMQMYGDRFGGVESYKNLEATLKKTGVGKYYIDGSDNIPAGWVKLDPSNRIFHTEHAYMTSDGTPTIGKRSLYAPKVVADAIKPLISEFSPPKWLTKIYGGNMKIKGFNVFGSLFHAKNLAIQTLYGLGPIKGLKAAAVDITSPESLAIQREWVKDGATFSNVSKTAKAYKDINNFKFPTEEGQLLNNPDAVNKLNKTVNIISHYTFDILQTQGKAAYLENEFRKWTNKNSNATDTEIADARRNIAKQANATFGGINMEAMGISKGAQFWSRILGFSPDWTISKYLNAKYAFEGGAGGASARSFFIKSVIFGAAANQIASLLFSGKPSKKPWMTYMGKDKNGKDEYVNLFFVHTTGEFINDFNYFNQYGIAGAGIAAGNKLSYVPRSLMQLATNRDYLGRQIVPKGSGFIAGTGMTALNFGRQQLPFGVQNLFSMLQSKSTSYSTKDFIIQSILGDRTIHIIPDGLRQVPSGKKKGQLVPITNKPTPNSLWTQITTGKINQPAQKKASSGRAGRKR